MRLGESRRNFPRPSARRGHRPGGAGWPVVSGNRGRVGQTVSRLISLGLAGVLVGALVYAMFKFFGMLSARHMDPRDLWFVPVAMVAVILVVVVRVVRPLLREILTKASSK